MTAADLVKSALRILGAIASGETPSASEQADGLEALNHMLDSWSTDGLMVTSYDRDVLKLTTGQSRYTIGATGNLVTSRPMRIETANITVPNTVITELTPFVPGNPLAVPPTVDIPATYRTDVYATVEFPIEQINIQKWSAIQNKNMSARPQKFYIEGSYPLNAINVWPSPNTETALVLYSHKQITNLLATDVINLPPGYAKAIKNSLAMELAPEFGRDPSALVIAAAVEGRANIKRQNTQPVYMKSDAFGLSPVRAFNIFTGE